MKEWPVLFRNSQPPQVPQPENGYTVCSTSISGSQGTFCSMSLVSTDIFLFSKSKRRTNFPNLFCQETLHVSDGSSAHHQEFSTVHSALVYVMQFWWQLSSTTGMELQFHPARAWKLSSNMRDICKCRMYSGKLLMMGRGTARNM